MRKRRGGERAGVDQKAWNEQWKWKDSGQWTTWEEIEKKDERDRNSGKMGNNEGRGGGGRRKKSRMRSRK